MTDLQPLRHGASGELHRQFQAALNRRLRSRGLGALTVKEDGITGIKTLEAARKGAWALGALSSTYDAITRERVIPVGVVRMVRNPGRRTDRQFAIAKKRMSQMRRERIEREKERQRRSARTLTVNAFLAQVGTVEHPSGSNGGGLITVMQTYWGFGRVPWCGISCGYFAVKHGKIDGLRSDVASVWAIEQHARNSHHPYDRWTSDVTGLLPASFIVIGGSGVHVAMKVKSGPYGSTKTVEGNTSFTDAGSQSNGGAIAARTRSPEAITGGAAMDYQG